MAAMNENIEYAGKTIMAAIKKTIKGTSKNWRSEGENYAKTPSKSPPKNDKQESENMHNWMAAINV